MLAMAALLLCSSLSLSMTSPEGTIHSGDSTVTVEEMLDVLRAADVVFVGENHEDAFAHEWEFFIWASLASGERALALEMFETDVQDVLDAYLSGEVSREEFLEGSRPWGNYLEAYAPMVELALEEGYRVIAANVPRHHASEVARGGWQALEGDPQFDSLTVDSSNVSYRERFLAAMDDFGDRMHAMPMSFDNLYRAQLLKDAVMAASAAAERCVFICGSFHSDYRSGIPDQLPEGTSFVTLKVLAENEELDHRMADFVIRR